MKKRFMVEVIESMVRQVYIEAEDADDAEEMGKQGDGDLIQEYCVRLDSTATEIIRRSD